MWAWWMSFFNLICLVMTDICSVLFICLANSDGCPVFGVCLVSSPEVKACLCPADVGCLVWSFVNAPFLLNVWLLNIVWCLLAICCLVSSTRQDISIIYMSGGCLVDLVICMVIIACPVDRISVTFCYWEPVCSWIARCTICSTVMRWSHFCLIRGSVLVRRVLDGETFSGFGRVALSDIDQWSYSHNSNIFASPESVSIPI